MNPFHHNVFQHISRSSRRIDSAAPDPAQRQRLKPPPATGNRLKPVRVIAGGRKTGSAVAATYSSNGSRQSERGYYAFGDDRRTVHTPLTDNLFTGQKQDESGLYYYNARYYDPEIGHFISPDAIVPDPQRVDAYNRYMYGYGNPLKYADPGGHYAICFQPGKALGYEAGLKNVDTSTAMWDLCQTLYNDRLLGSEWQIFGNDPDGAKAALKFLEDMQAKYPDESFILLGYSWGGGGALEFARLLDSLPYSFVDYGWPNADRQHVPTGAQIDVMVTIDPVVRWRRPGARQIYPANVTGEDPPEFGNVNRILNVLASKNAYAWFTAWDQGVEVPGAQNQPIPNTNHCSVGNSNCDGGLAPISFPMDDNSGRVNPVTLDLITDFLNSP
ncbi:MAG: RHS repeat-associated core domain-containing protein [Caldilineaceae bacterium]|nr:RHS repeat-associated core domain-containing protein [Caldilineaceae bacterium]